MEMQLVVRLLYQKAKSVDLPVIVMNVHCEFLCFEHLLKKYQHFVKK